MQKPTTLRGIRHGTVYKNTATFAKFYHSPADKHRTYTKTPLHLQNFTVTKTYSKKQRGIRTFFVCGHLEEERHRKLCPCCGYQAFHSNGKRTIKLKHMSVADFQIVVELEYTRWKCQICHACFRAHIPFKEKGHRITKLFMQQLLEKPENGNTVLRTAKEFHSNRNLVKKKD